MTVFGEAPVTRAEVLQELHAQATVLRPRLFAVYGCHRTALHPFLG